MLTEQDHRAIEDLYARYNVTIDSGDADGWAAVWAVDAEFHASRLVCGRDDLRAFAVDKPNRMRRDGWYRMQHVNSNLLVDGDGDRARGSCYLVLLTQRSPDTVPGIAKMGVYHDDLIKVDESWLFQKRVVDFTFSAVPA